MKLETIAIKGATLYAYLQENTHEIDVNRKHPAMLILPGGGYSGVSDREGGPLALACLGHGYSAFVLRYSVGPNEKYPTQLNQAEEALRYIRQHADEWNIHPNHIAVMGFSAGGHLAGNLATAGEERPDAAILCYPVITAGEYAHRDSFIALGAEISLEKCVDDKTPPTFLWHTANDGLVPVENSLLMASALQQKKIPFELHIFQDGPHGLALCNEQTAGPNAEHFLNPHAAHWFPLCIEWCNQLFFKGEK